MDTKPIKKKIINMGLCCYLQFKDRVKGTIEVTETEHSYTVENLKAGYMYEFEVRTRQNRAYVF